MIILGKSRVVATTVALALASSLSLTLAPPASAQGAAKPAAAKVDPKTAFASGEKKFKANDFAGALADFEASEAAKADPATERYIAQSHDNLQHYADAVAAYEKFIASNPPKKAEVDEAKKRVEAIKAMPGKVKVETAPPGASVVVDTAQTPYEKTTPTEIDLAPGHHTLLIGAEGYENTTKEVDVTYGSKHEVKAELTKKEAAAPAPAPPVAAEKPAPAPAPPAPPPEPRSKVPAYVTAGVAIVGAGVGTVFGIKALGQSSDFKKNPTTKTADDGENNALVADMMFGIAITFGVTSAVLFLSNDAPTTTSANEPRVAKSEPKKKIQIIPTPYVSPSGGGMGTLIKF